MSNASMENMKVQTFFLPAVLLGIYVFSGLAQDDPIIGHNTFGGILKTNDGKIISGATLFVHRGDVVRSFAADINGEFRMSLQPGDYEITTSSTTAPNFKAFIKIIDHGLNPDNVEFVFDPSKVCCSDADGIPYPKALSLPKPPYPPAARAVRASGEVVVNLKVDGSGKVVSAEAKSGHPLLRNAAEAAARSSRFESSAETERMLRLTYVFLAEVTEKNGIARYSDPYRIEVISIAVFLDTADIDHRPSHSLPQRIKWFFRF